MDFLKKECYWIRKPKKSKIEENTLVIETDSNTDLWQRTYYGFQNDNAPLLLTDISDKEFSFIVKTEFNSKKLFDQCGVIIYQDSENWFKASIEYENEKIQRLGSVVTNLGFSDWATTDIPAEHKKMYYRLSRRGSDFCIENSYDGINYSQMRIFHLVSGKNDIKIGVYACSPSDSSFKALFSEMYFTDCKWQKHS